VSDTASHPWRLEWHCCENIKRCNIVVIVLCSWNDRAGITVPSWQCRTDCDVTASSDQDLQCWHLLAGVIFVYAYFAGVCDVDVQFIFDRLSQWLRRLDGWHRCSQMHGSTSQWSMKIPWMHGETSWRNQHNAGTNCNRQNNCRPTLMSIEMWC